MKAIHLLYALAALAISSWIVFNLAKEPAPVYAQGSNTVSQTLVQNSTASMPVILGPINNIGQGFHQVVISVSKQNGHTCLYGSGASPLVSVFGSFLPLGGGSYPFGTPLPGRTRVTWDSTLFTGTVQEIGSFPYLYVEINSVDTANCQYSVYYSGTLYPATPVDPYVGQAVGANVPENLSTAVYSVTGSTNPQELGTMSVNLTENIYALRLSNDGTTNQNVSLTCGSGGATLDSFTALQAGQTIVLPYTQSPYYSCFASGIWLNRSNTAGTVTAWVQVGIQ